MTNDTIRLGINKNKLPITGSIFRFLLFIALLFTVDNLIDLASYPLLLVSAGTFGILTAAFFSASRISSRGAATLILFCSALLNLIVDLFANLKTPETIPSLSFVVLADHLQIALGFFCILSVSSLLIFRHRWAITLELFSLLIGFTWLLSAHREMKLDKPKWIAQLAWDLRIEYLSTFIIVAALFLLAVTSYTAAVSFNLTQEGVTKAKREGKGGRNSELSNKLAKIGALLILPLFFSTLGFFLYNQLKITVGNRSSNGVGQESQEGLSPLNFHSAVGSTSQPAALVRLDGDYTRNPFGKRLYLRESALSQLGNNEMVIAPPRFDQDISRASPLQPFHRDEDPDLNDRVRVPQSIYLLAMNQSPFAIDYPISLTQLKNPKPNRFKASYKAVSLAPTISLDSLKNRGVGDPRWSDEERLHYTIYHPDYRYTEMAKTLTKGITDPVSQAFAIKDWLSKNVIYTLTPNHTVPEGGDPVEPFLFSKELRGYCVHFSHATVYLLRSLSIPSRIATGYMTDLSQSKDGHILLRMSDRHAWAEVYIQGVGWFPFDTYPEKVENHADSPVDVKALEELMGMIGPDEEIFKESDIADESAFSTTPSKWTPPSPKYPLYFLGVIILCLYSIKIYVRFSWIIRKQPKKRLKASFRSILSILRDAGIKRAGGETYLEYDLRLTQILGTPCLMLRQILQEESYKEGGFANLSCKEIDKLRESDLNNFKSRLQRSKIGRFASLTSAIAFLRGELS